MPTNTFAASQGDTLYNWSQFTVYDKCTFTWIVIISTIAIRVVFTALRVKETSPRFFTFSKHRSREHELTPLEIKKAEFCNLRPNVKFWAIFWGGSGIDPAPDFWYNTFIGTMELIIYPFLFKWHLYTFIGAWMVFKTYGQWDAWKTNRLAYNRFIIINALLLIISYASMHFI